MTKTAVILCQNSFSEFSRVEFCNFADDFILFSVWITLLKYTRSSNRICMQALGKVHLFVLIL